jgi:7-carboxy-7-deazaguanine synthase
MEKELEEIVEAPVGTVLPISEIFVSPQGEGVYTGTPMCFIRTAGCTVGKPFPKAYYREGEALEVGPGLRDVVVEKPLLPIYTEKCTFSDGREFACDTDYRVKFRMSIESIIEKVPQNVMHVCITGGEPLMHQGRLLPLLRQLRGRGYKIHIETSGTINLAPSLPIDWLTVSPKLGVLDLMLTRANELKILVDDDFNLNRFPFSLVELASYRPVFLQPVNHEHSVNAHNLKLCVDWQKKYPCFRISLQLHKVLEHFIGERIL